MIQGFSDIITRDLTTVMSANKKQTGEQQKKVHLAAMRLFAAGVMGTAAFGGVLALTAFFSAPAAAVWGVGIYAIIYAVAHDVFKFSQNIENHNNTNGLWTEGKSLWNSIWSGENKRPETFADMVSENTILKPIWKALFTVAFTKIENEQ